jgi:hypothetical protein
MRNCFYVVLLWLLTTFAANAQRTSFEAGYIVTTTDTIRGLLLKTDEVKLGQELQFKTSESSNAIIYTPGEIQSFSFSKEGFIFQAVELKLRQDSSITKTNRFAKLILKGYTSLYKVQLADTELKTIFELNNNFVYVVQKNDVYHTLAQYESMIDDRHFRLNKHYLGMLISLTSDCNSIKISENLAFEDSQIIEVISNYNDCIKPNTSKIYAYKVKFVKKHGVSFSYGTLVNFFSDNSSSNSSAPSFAYFWDIADPSRSKNTSFFTGLNYMYLSYSFPSTNNKLSKVQEHYLKIPLLGQKNFYNKRQALPFINFGLTLQANTDNGLNYVDIVPFVNLGAGLYINKFRLSLMLENPGLSFKSNQILNFGVGYRLDHIK